mgnify:CR=1 FL=1
MNLALPLRLVRQASQGGGGTHMQEKWIQHDIILVVAQLKILLPCKLDGRVEFLIMDMINFGHHYEKDFNLVFVLYRRIRWSYVALLLTGVDKRALKLHLI